MLIIKRHNFPLTKVIREHNTFFQRLIPNFVVLAKKFNVALIIYCRYELQERGLLNKEEVQVVPDIYIRFRNYF